LIGVISLPSDSMGGSISGDDSDIMMSMDMS